jgi:hypothetical protein
MLDVTPLLGDSSQRSEGSFSHFQRGSNAQYEWFLYCSILEEESTTILTNGRATLTKRHSATCQQHGCTDLKAHNKHLTYYNYQLPMSYGIVNFYHEINACC